MVRRVVAVPTCLVVLAALVVGAGWLWLRPKAHVALPGPSATPGQVVRAYVNALDARDFATSNAMTSAHLDIHNHWWSRPGTIDDLHVSRAHLIGHLSLAYRDSLASVEDDRYAADVTYNYRGERSQILFPMPGGDTLVEQYEYDDAGNTLCVYTYMQGAKPSTDDNGCPADPSSSELYALRQYDYQAPNGNQTNTAYKITTKGGEFTTYSYDHINRLTEAESKLAGTTKRDFDYTYDRHSNLTQSVVTGSPPA